MNTLPPRPSALLQMRTNGCGAFNERRVLISGVQKRKRIVVVNAPTPVKTALLKMLRAATELRNDKRRKG
jgi:hypothetical protein